MANYTQADLVRARNALMDLKINGGVVSVETEAGKTTWSPPDVKDLEAFVEKIEASLASPTRRRRGAIGVSF